MKRTIFGVLFGFALIPALAPPAKADCLREAIDSCNTDFPPSDKFGTAIRGWCYLIRTGMCKALDSN